MTIKTLLHRCLTSSNSRRKTQRRRRAATANCESLEVRLLLSAITGAVFDDASTNGVKDDGERLVEGLPVHLWSTGADENAGTSDDVLVESTLTDTVGAYGFNIEPTGTYFVQFGSQTGLFGFTEQVVATEGQVASDADAGTTFSATFTGGASAVDVELNAGIVVPDDEGTARDIAKEAFSFQLTREDYHVNVYGENEKWLYGQRGSLSSVYFITPDGDLYNWDLTPRVTSGEFIGNVGTDAYTDPSTLIGEPSVDVASETDAEAAYRLDRDHNLRARGTWYEDYADLGVRWLLGNVNSHGNQWYFVTPEGEFWAWDRVPGQASGTKLADLSSDYFNDPILLTNAQRPGEALEATSRVKDAFGLTMTTVAPAAVVEGGGTVWLDGAVNEFGNRVYFLNNEGDLHAWDGTASAAGRELTSLDASVFTNPDILVNALAPIDISSPQQAAYDLSQIYRLNSPGWYFRDFGGQGEVWVQGSRNLHNNNWYFALPNGDFTAWDGTPRTATGTKLATLSPLYNALPHLLHTALPPIGSTTVSPNTPPTIVAIENASAVIGDQLVVSVTATDSNVGDTLTFSIDANISPADVIIQPTGNRSALIRWTPTLQHAGSAVPFRVTVNDGRNGQDSEEFVVNVATPTELTVVGEGASFSTSVSQAVELGQSSGSRRISFDLQDAFDRTDTTAAIEDIFQVHLRDAATGEALLEGRSPGTAVFSLAGEVAEYQPGTVRYDGTRVEIDVTSLGDLTSADLVFQFINSDSDDGSIVALGTVTSIINASGLASRQPKYAVSGPNSNSAAKAIADRATGSSNALPGWTPGEERDDVGTINFVPMNFCPVRR